MWVLAPYSCCWTDCVRQGMSHLMESLIFISDIPQLLVWDKLWVLISHCQSFLINAKIPNCPSFHILLSLLPSIFPFYHDKFKFSPCHDMSREYGLPPLSNQLSLQVNFLQYIFIMVCIYLRCYPWIYYIIQACKDTSFWLMGSLREIPRTIVSGKTWADNSNTNLQAEKPDDSL